MVTLLVAVRRWFWGRQVMHVSRVKKMCTRQHTSSAKHPKLSPTAATAVEVDGTVSGEDHAGL